jgi:transcriptional regulator with XRE-family HTH domain
MLKVDKNKMVLARAQSIMTIRQLSKMSKVAASTISRIEKGHIDPNPVTVGKIAKALNVSVNELIEPVLK